MNMRLDRTGDTVSIRDAPMDEGAEITPSGVRTVVVLRWGLVALAAFAAAGTWVYSPKALSRAERSRAAAPSVADAKSEHRGAYVCPMHPEISSNDPHATCPKCGMRLVPTAVNAAPTDVSGTAPLERLGLVRYPGRKPRG